MCPLDCEMIVHLNYQLNSSCLILYTIPSCKNLTTTVKDDRIVTNFKFADVQEKSEVCSCCVCRQDTIFARQMI
jgi:hypothetical protein